MSWQQQQPQPTTGAPPPVGFQPGYAGQPGQHPYPPQNTGYFVGTPGAPVHTPEAMQGSHSYDDAYEGPSKADRGFGFSEQSIRRGFIRKVYSILAVQLLITLGFVCIFVFVDDVKRYSRQHPEMYWIAFGLTFATIIVLSCCENVRRKSPANLIFLFLFTVCESFMIGSVCSYYDASDVVFAIGICSAVCLGLTLFALQTKWDFTMMSGIMLVVLICFLFFGLFAIIFPSKVMILLYCSIGAVIFSVYLVIDTQLMLGGKHKYALSPEEYVFAALNLYLDIVNIFLYILAIIGIAND